MRKKISPLRKKAEECLIGHRWEQKGEWNLEKKDETTEIN